MHGPALAHEMPAQVESWTNIQKEWIGYPRPGTAIQPHSGDGKEKYSNLSTPDRTSRRGRMSRAVLECRLRCRTLLLGRSGHPQRLTAYSTHLYMCTFDQARHSFGVKLSECLALQLVLQLPNYTTGGLTKLSSSSCSSQTCSIAARIDRKLSNEENMQLPHLIAFAASC